MSKKAIEAAILSAENWPEDVKCEVNWYNDSRKVEEEECFQTPSNPEFG